MHEEKQTNKQTKQTTTSTNNNSKETHTQTKIFQFYILKLLNMTFKTGQCHLAGMNTWRSAQAMFNITGSQEGDTYLAYIIQERKIWGKHLFPI